MRRVAARVWGRASGASRLALLTVGVVGPGVIERTPAPRQPRPPQCNAVSDRDVVPAHSTLDTGQYTLTMVATSGPSGGASAQGGLWLAFPRGARDTDAHGASPTRPYRLTAPVYGATEVDLGGVGATVPPDDNSAVPTPHAFDQRRPGVLVSYQVDSATSGAVWRLYIATARNDQRTCQIGEPCWHPPTEGPGVVLDVHKVDATGFAGSWRPVATSEARGYFCAAPVRYYSRYKTRTLPEPPPTH
jgi:hypothetical protein